MRNTQTYLDSLNSAFPDLKVLGEVAHHDCAECASLRKALNDKVWSELDTDFLRDNYDALPLLTSEAFNAFIAAWLRYALSNSPDEVSEYLLIHLSNVPKTNRFTKHQAKVLLGIVDFLYEKMPEFDLDEETVIDQQKIHRVWQSVAA